MLARASSDAGNRLRRSKSTSTVHRHPPPISEHLDPDVAHQHALAAATAAFARAQVHDTTDRKSKRSSEISRSKSTASGKSLSSQGSHFPPRESSFRSLQPRKTGQATDTQRQSRAPTMNTEQFPPFYPTPSSDRPLSVPRPLSTQPSVTFSDTTRPGAQLKSLRQSASSSVTSQQIRKARSMYYASSIQTGSPIARPPAKYLTTPPPITVSPTMEPMPSLPPTRALGPSPLAGPRVPVSVTADESIDNARDKYLQEFQQKTIKHKPSMFLAPFKKRQDKAKGKGKRSTSGVISVSTASHRTPDESTADVSLNDFLPQPEVKEKRSFSGSLKSKFKRVFRRTSNKSPNLHVQQIDASRDYFNSTHLSPPHVEDAYDIPSPDNETLQRVRARTPSLEGARPAFIRSGSRSSSNGSDRSNRSLHSETNVTNLSVSRVTSWGTSSTGDTLTQRAIKRLTVIHEARDSIGSEADRVACMMPKRKSLPVPSLAAFREPVHTESLAEDSLTHVDPKRVFSALMREIGASKPEYVPSDRADRTPGAESDVFESSETKELHSQTRGLHSSASRDFRSGTASDLRPPSRRPPTAQSAQSKTSTIRSLGRAIRSTIRTVTPAEEHYAPSPERTGSVHGAVRVPRDDVDTPSSTAAPGSEGSDDHYSKDDSPDVEGANMKVNSTDEHNAMQVFTPSTAQIEQRVERAKDRWKTALDEAEMLQFPRETNRTYNVANFAQQTILCETTNDTTDFATQLHIDTHEFGKHQNQESPESSKSPTPLNRRPVMSPLSPSIYSRNTDGISILPNDSIISLGGPDDSEPLQDGGSAVILTSQSVRSYVIGTPSPRRPDSTRTSRDWKAWLSHEISGMELDSEEDLRICERNVTPCGPHGRDISSTSHNEHSDMTVILRETVETSTGPDIGTSTSTNTSNATGRFDSQDHSNGQNQSGPGKTNTVLERSDSHTDTIKEVTPTHTPIETMSGHPQVRRISSRPDSTLVLSKERPPSTPGCRASISQPILETPGSSRMNDRFPFIDTGRGSSSNSAKSSRQSKSSTDSNPSLKSLKSPKATPNPKIYSDLSAPASNQTSQRVPNTALKRSDAQLRKKENVTPPALLDNNKTNVRPLGLTSRPKSMQPLSSAAMNLNSSSTGQYQANAAETSHAKRNSSPAATPPRPRVRATLRPLSPEKLARRPRSSFDLRQGNTRYQLQTTGRPTITSLGTPSPPPCSELRRPVVHLKTPSSSLAFNLEPSPGREERVIDSILDSDRSGSVTPGQRMADRFLKERKSTTILESARMRGGLRLAREDTPAFL